MAGTPAYLAPEVVACIQRKPRALRRFTPAVDMWAAGASLFLMLGGYPPFDGTTTLDVFNSILDSQTTFLEPSWEAVSQRAKTLIMDLMQHDSKRRRTAMQALATDWIMNPPADPRHRRLHNANGDDNVIYGGGGGGEGNILEESGRGLARYRRRSSSSGVNRDLNLSGSFMVESPMLQLQEKHGDSRGAGLNESLRKIFGMNKARLPSAALNTREQRAPAMQRGHVSSYQGSKPGGSVAPLP
eukprot:CAMPEP_0198694120 /NCGR_PEP_ID=MMETSP1468-20131203/263377_1 /TAXON_ID=1461545 /ORGANISM="Mantoniella sp, Strain CCMP1436" /LENGTH=242 /DNA_ID=CAMNT_0044449125 /DNA_START=1 /DNA_END=726 /DNA_ORIENTATION=+